MKRWPGRATVLIFSGFLLCAGSMPGIPFEDDFENGSGHWEMTDPSAWRVIDDGGSRVLALTGESRYQPPFRSPRNIALIKDLETDSFVLEASLKSTHEPYGHRDLCLIFGWQDASHFYYVHLADEADETANSIFIVDGQDRRSIALRRSNGTNWDGAYHRVRLVRKAKTGEIQVFFDDVSHPVMEAIDSTFSTGRLGLGSFDDTGYFDNVEVRQQSR